MRIAIALLVATVAFSLATAGAPAKSHRVLLVGTYHGKAGDFRSITAAVKAAKPGDWILVAPGDYKETVSITKDGIHLRGLDRNKVVVDGTKSGPTCSSKVASPAWAMSGSSGCSAGPSQEMADVPDEAVVTGPNRDGRTLVWYYDSWTGHSGIPGKVIKCFMPGTMT